jgi:hypothetical membrane protein
VDVGATRTRALGGIIGPVAFMTTSWLAGIASAHYSVVQNAISDLAARGAPTHVFMTGAFVVYGGSLLFYASALRLVLDGPAWCAAGVAGIGAFGLAASPRHSGARIDTVHSWFAIAFGAGVALTPLLAARSLLRAGHDRWSRLSLAAGALSFVCLMITLVGPERGLLQRAGLGVVHCWLIGSAVVILRSGRFGGSGGSGGSGGFVGAPSPVLGAVA